MFVISRRSIILPGPDGAKFHMPRDYMGPVPAWAEDSPYLKALAKDGKVVLSDSSRDQDVDAATRRRGNKGKKAAPPPKQPEECGELEEETAEPAGESAGENSGEDA